ncbi:hypothetical protein I8H83_04670 [Candidatus Saccharibacteria bacterium]|nr:hypothetical protein [Candidatus Saccharibacteria bacterium]
MPKTKKQSFNKKAFLKITVSALLVLFVIISAVIYLQYKPLMDNPTNIRDMLIRSSRDSHINAPIEPKTGDVYFPEMKLYVPRGDAQIASFTYRYDTSYEGWPESISVTSRDVTDQAELDLYNAVDSEKVFSKVPYMQACRQGLTLTAQPLPSLDGEKLHHQQALQDGRMLYVYTNTGCPALTEVVDDINRINSY